MWLRLGDNEIINMNLVVSIKKGLKNSIEISFQGMAHAKVLPFQAKEERDAAFEKLVENLVKMRLAME